MFHVRLKAVPAEAEEVQSQDRVQWVPARGPGRRTQRLKV